MTRRLRAWVLAVPFVLAACGSRVELKQAVEIVDVSTGWVDGGVKEGKNRLLPSVTFRIRKTDPNADIQTVALNVGFRVVGEQDNREDVFVQRIEIGANGQTAPIVVRPESGYAADPPQSRAEMLKNSYFQDMEARIFGRQSSAQWTELHQVKIERRLLAQ
jgi:hypothetical protein